MRRKSHVRGAAVLLSYAVRKMLSHLSALVLALLSGPCAAAGRVKLDAFPYFSKVTVLADTRFGLAGKPQIQLLERRILPQTLNLLAQSPEIPKWFRFEPVQAVADIDLPRSLMVNNNKAVTREAAKHLRNLLQKLEEKLPDHENLPVMIANMRMYDGFRGDSRGYAVDLYEILRMEWIGGRVMPERPLILIANSPERPFYDDSHRAALVLGHELVHLTGQDHSNDHDNLMYSYPTSPKLTREQVRLIRRWLRYHGHLR